MTYKGFIDPIKREHLLDFIVYEQESPTAPHRKVAAYDSKTHTGLKIGMLVDDKCVPVAKFKVAADVTALKDSGGKDVRQIAGISLCSAGLYDGLTAQGEAEAVYITSSNKARVTLKDVILERMAEYHVDDSVADANVVAAIISAIKAKLISMNFDFVDTGL